MASVKVAVLASPWLATTAPAAWGWRLLSAPVRSEPASQSRREDVGNQLTVAAGAGNSTTVDNATVVRVLNASGSTVQIIVQDSAFAGIGSFTMLNNTSEMVEKKASDLIHSTGGLVRLAKVGFTG